VNNRLVEIPAYLAGRFAVDRVGRKVPLVVGLLAGGIACLATGLVPEGRYYLTKNCIIIS